MDVTHLREQGLLLSYKDIPDSTAVTVKYIFLDAVLALIAGIRSVPEAEKARLAAVLDGEPAICRPVWPVDRKMSREMAGFINGYCIRYADWGDAMRPPRSRGGHPSDMCAALLAMCDAPGLGGERAVEALHLAYQLWALVQNRMMYKRPEYDPTTYLSLTLPVMLSACAGDSPERTQNALNLSAANGTTLLQVRPHDITNLKCGATGYAIARAIWLHRLGQLLDAPASMFDGANGWYKVVAGFDGEIEKMDDDAVYEQIQVKAIPCCNVNQASSECGIRLHERLGGDIRRIKRIRVKVSPTDAGIALKPGKPKYPYDHPTADHHIGYCLAVTLKYGALAPLHYEERFLKDPELRGLIDITEGSVLTDDELASLGGGKGPCIVELELDDGSVLRESEERPAGYFVGLGADERNAGLKKTLAAKRAAIEKCYGYDLSGVESIVMSLEKHQTTELIDELQRILRQ